MIENLRGIQETVNFTQSAAELKLYNNVEAESYPPHWHTPFEVIMPVTGSYRVLCGDHDYHLQERDILLICPGVLHELIAPPEGSRIILQLTLTNFDLRELDTITATISPAVMITQEQYPEIHDTACQLLLDIQKEYSQTAPYYATFIYAKFLEILGLIARSSSKSIQTAIPSRKKEYVEKFLYVCSYINEHFSEDLTLDQMASLAGFSKYHFSRLFRQYMNIPFYQFLNQKRINYAKTLLINQQLPILDIALSSGFSCHTAFLRMFKLHTGYTPTEFRKMYNSGGILQKEN